MFVQLCALAAVLPFVSALTINAPTGATVGGTVTVTWTASTSDASSFSLELVNTAFNNEYAIATNVPTAQGSLTFTMPQVPPGETYTLNAIAVNNVNDVYASSGSFVITTPTSTTGSTTSASTTSSASSISSGTLSTLSSSSTSPVSSVSGVTTLPSTSAASTAASASPSTFSSGAASFKMAGVVPAAVLVLSAVAGAAMLF